jgi:hypothetical protein
MTRDIFAEVERDIKRPLRERERDAIAGLFLGCQLPADRRKRKRCAQKALQEARQAEIRGRRIDDRPGPRHIDLKGQTNA